MRYITKNKLGYPQLELKNNVPPSTSQEARVKWKGFKPKRPLLEALLSEQYNICCYSELCAKSYDFGYHIEHILNKGVFPRLTFEYANLAASALSSHDLASMNGVGERSAFGGHAAGKSCSVDESLLITPHQPDCEKFFVYLSSGVVVPTKGLSMYEVCRANYTITSLNLNSPFLVCARKAWWDELNGVLIGHLTDKRALRKMAELYIGSTEGSLKSFYSMNFQMFGHEGRHFKEAECSVE